MPNASLPSLQLPKAEGSESVENNDPENHFSLVDKKQRQNAEEAAGICVLMWLCSISLLFRSSPLDIYFMRAATVEVG